MTAQSGASSAQLPIYPYYCRTLSATLGRWCPVTAKDVHALEQVSGFEGQDVYFYKNHMIKYVRLTGVIVAVDEYYERMTYVLDDSSGVNIEFTCRAPPKPLLDEGVTIAAAPNIVPLHVIAKPQELISPDGPNLTGIDVGSIVKVKGGIRIFRDQKNIQLKTITVLGDTNAEVKCWNDMIKFKREVLSKPWIVTAEEEEQCRLEIDREARWKIEEGAKKKEDEMQRYLKQRKRELREEQRKSDARENTNHEGEEARKRKARDGPSEGLDPVNRVNYPSKSARRRAAGKYDALGI